jgi:hypothetical protein
MAIVSLASLSLSLSLSLAPHPLQSQTKNVFVRTPRQSQERSLRSQAVERTSIPADLVEKASAAVKAITAEPIRINYNPSEKTQSTVLIEEKEKK